MPSYTEDNLRNERVDGITYYPELSTGEFAALKTLRI